MLNLRSASNIKLIPQWVPRKKFELAYHYSRFNDTDNLSMDHESLIL